MRVDQRDACGCARCVRIKAVCVDRRCLCGSKLSVWINVACVDERCVCESTLCAWINTTLCVWIDSGRGWSDNCMTHKTSDEAALIRKDRNVSYFDSC